MRVLLTTFGSLGDLHPFVALARGLRERGHRPVIASSGLFRARVEAAGVEFAPVRPDVADLGDESEILRRASHPRTGTEYVLRELALPWVRPAFEDLDRLAADADLIVSHSLTFAAPLVAEKRRLPWAAVQLQPFVMLSAYDPPIPAQAAWMSRLRWLGPRFFRTFWKLPRRLSRPWFEPIRALRAEVGLPATDAHPLFDGQFSPYLNLALFSRHIAPPQRDWPAHTRCVGFVYHDRDEGGAGLSAEMRGFLDAGPPPVVWTLGSSVVANAGDFYAVGLRAARRVGIRSVLLIGKDAQNRPDDAVGGDVHVEAYAPYSELFPHAAAVVHQGGIGTTAQALRAGVPMLMVPFAHDQPDNAFRIERLGVGRSLAVGRFRMPRAAGELRRLLTHPRYTRRAAALGRLIRAEDGLAEACDAIERLFAGGVPPYRNSSAHD